MKEIRVLFVNPPNPQCGVHQYGLNLISALKRSKRYWVYYCAPQKPSDLHIREEDFNPDWFIFNYHPGIIDASWYRTYACTRPSIAIYHDGPMDEDAYRAILFSDPGMPQHGKWFPIGRPLPGGEPRIEPVDTFMPVIGINGFMGAWAPLALMVVLREINAAVIRLHLPHATYGDSQGVAARDSEAQCRALLASRPTFTLDVSHEFFSAGRLLSWLKQNDLNLYVRNLPPTWRGVSSVLDYAMAAGRPIAINSNVAFRHLHGLNPSIQVEHNSLRTIMQNGIRPWKILLESWAPERICAQVEAVLDCLIGLARPAPTV